MMQSKTNVLLVIGVLFVSILSATTGNFLWVSSTQGTPTSIFGPSSGGGLVPTVNPPFVSQNEYLIYSREGLSLGGNALVEGNVSLLNGSPMTFSGEKKFIQGKLVVENPGVNGFTYFKNEYQDYVESAIEQVPFNEPVCCTDFDLGFAFIEVDEEENIGNKETAEVSEDTYYQDGLYVGNGGTLKILSGTSEDVTVLLISSLTVKGDIVIEGNGLVIIKVLETLIVEGDVYWNTFPNVNPGSEGDPKNLLILYDGTEYAQNGGRINGYLGFSDSVTSVKLAGNMILNGALYAPKATVEVNGTVGVSQWMYGTTFDIKGTVNVYP